jgi:hypothetical protein
MYRPRDTKLKRMLLNESQFLLEAAEHRNSAKILLSRGACWRAIYSSRNMLLMRIDVILLGSDKSTGGAKPQSLKRVLTATAYPRTVADQRDCLLL